MTATTNSVNLLDEFRSSTSMSPSLLQSLVHRLLSHPKVFNGFNDVLKLPNVRESLDKMDDARRSALVRTVELFAHGTVGQYFETKRRNGDEVWKLNDVQLEKLRMLTVASVARRHLEDAFPSDRSGRYDDAAAGGDGGGGGGGVAGGDDVEMKMAAFKIKKCDDGARNNGKTKTKKKKKKKTTTNDLCIPYSRLASELHIPHNPHDDDDVGGGGASSTPYNDADHMRQLEDVLIQCIYSNIVAARLDQSSRSLVITPHVSLTPDSDGVAGGVIKERDRGAFSGGGGGTGGVGGGGAVHGSVLSRDLDTTTPERARAEASRMLASLRNFLERSNAALSTIDKTSRVVVASDRREDESRWAGVQRSIDSSGMSRQREGGMSSFAGGGGGGGGDGGVGPMGMGLGGTRLGGMTMEGGAEMGGGGDPMEVTDGGAGVGRRQVKRSKGGHSMMI